ncbi:MAG TPA: YtxH domain-containing protein [Gemmatimonadaceae bacterium]
MTRDERSEHEVEDSEERVVVVKRSSGISPFLIGLAVGAGLALLFAPASGAETRRRLARGARRMRHAAAGAAEDVRDKVSDTLEAAREGVGERIDSARDTIATKRGQVRRAVSEGRAEAQQARQDIEKRLAETKAAYQAGARVARERKTHDD